MQMRDMALGIPAAELKPLPRWEETRLDGKPCRVLGAAATAARERRDAAGLQMEQRARRAAAQRLGKSFATADGRAAILRSAGLSPAEGATQVDLVGDVTPVPDIDPGGYSTGLGTTTTVGSGLPTTRYRYAWYDAAPPRPSTNQIFDKSDFHQNLIAPPSVSQHPAKGPGPQRTPFDPCDPTWIQTRTEFDVCLGDDFTFTDAVAFLEAHSPGSWESDLWASVDSCFDAGAKRLENAEFERLLPVGDGAEMWLEQWDPSPTGMNYTSSTSQPRKTVLRAALDLILCRSTGIPEHVATATGDGGADRKLRKHVIDPIRDGWMSYHMYREGGPDSTWADVLRLFASLTSGALAEGMNILQYGVANRWGVSSALTGPIYATLVDIESFFVHALFEPAQCTEVSSWAVVSTPTAQFYPASSGSLGANQDVRTSDCAGATGMIDLSGDADFEFLYLGVPGRTFGGANHGIFTPRVWFCPDHVDRAAVMYDWFVSLATRHFAASQDEDRGVVDRSRQALAANICLRRACSVAGELGKLLVHETSHNVNLYHCYDPWTATPQACFQDVAAYSWWVYVQARLGTARTIHASPSKQTFGAHHLPDVDSTAISRNYWSFGDPGTDDPVLGWDVKPGTQRVSEAVLECSQGDGLTDGGEAAALLLAEVLGVLPLGLVVGPELVAYLSAVVAQNTRVLGEKRDLKTLEFVVRHPLVAGSDVSQCCVHRSTNCLAGGRTDDATASSDCWTSGETGAAGCCRSDGGGGDTYDPPGGGGGNAPGLPGPRKPDVPDYDDSDIVVDGSAESAGGS